MITVRRAQERGHANHGWLDSYHTFSFGDYYDSDHMGMSNLRVINDDTVGPGGGFSTHGHRDMEIVSYVLDGALEHKDSMGNGYVIHSGDVQLMSAGSGVRHSEYNHSSTDPVHFLQIWLEPNTKGVEPGYDQRYFTPGERQGRLVLLVSPDGRDGSIRAHQDALLFGTFLRAEDRLSHELTPGKNAYVQVARGSAKINDELLEEGDGAAIVDASAVRLDGVGTAEVLLFDLP